MKTYKSYGMLGALLSAVAFADGRAAEPPAVVFGYARHYGTPVDERTTGIALDTSGNVLVAGNRTASGGSPYRIDGFIRKYDALGTRLWHRDVVSASADGIATDENGDVYTVGSYTAGSWPSERDYILLEKRDAAGTTLWTKRFTVPVASDRTRLIANAVAAIPVGAGFVAVLFEKAYYPYQTRQVFVRKYNVRGGLVWERQVADTSPYVARPSLAVDADGNIYTASNSVSYQRWNATLVKLNGRGVAVWTDSLVPESADRLVHVHALGADHTGNLYLTGIVQGDLFELSKGSHDVFLRKYDSGGAVSWTRQFGTDRADYGNALTIDTTGKVYVVGSTMGALQGTNRGSYDPYVRKYDSEGELLKGRQFGTSEFDIANAVRVHDDDTVYVGGDTYGNLGGPAKGSSDVWLRKYELFQ